MTGSPSLAKVRKGSLCAGCGLCAGISDDAIAMQIDDAGFARPEQKAPLTAKAEAVFADACPALKVEPWDGFDEVSAIDTYWGPSRRVLTGHATDGETRHTGSSGGAISAVAIHALESGLAKQVLQIVADPDRPLGNRVTISSTKAEILGAAGSRYAPSSPLATIETFLDAGTPTVFVGKPCDVSALRRLARHDARVDKVFPLKLSFFCGGIPSERGAERIVQEMGLEPRSVVNFRYRGNGWPGLTVAEDKDGRRGEMRYEDSWGRYLSSAVQFRCKICPDPVGGVADIACADAWYGGETGYPQFEEADGRSLIMVRTETGERLVDDMVKAGSLAATSLDIREIDLMQPAQARRKRRISTRMAAWRAALRPVTDVSGLRVGEAAAREPLGIRLKEFAGTMRRIVQGRI